MRRRRDFWDQAGEQMGLSGNRGMSGMRSPGRGTRYWSPSDALQSQPFHGFPGGRLAWEQFKMTGELPGAAQGLSKEAQSHYFNRIPAGVVDESLAVTDPMTGEYVGAPGDPLAPFVGRNATAVLADENLQGTSKGRQSSFPNASMGPRTQQATMGPVGDPLSRVLFGL